MSTWEWIAIIAVLALFALVALAIVVRVRRRRAHLAETFGDEYHRTASLESPRAAERKLTAVEKEHDELEIRELAPVARERYLGEWHEAERRFVSDPADAVRSAERLVTRLLEERGYPADAGGADAPPHGADAPPHVAVDHPRAFERYRQARSHTSNGHDETERLRQALLDYRTAFEDLLGSRTAA